MHKHPRTRKTSTVEVAVTANKKHRGIVDLKTVGKDSLGRTVGTNGINWRLK